MRSIVKGDGGWPTSHENMRHAQSTGQSACSQMLLEKSSKSSTAIDMIQTELLHLSIALYSTPVQHESLCTLEAHNLVAPAHTTWLKLSATEVFFLGSCESRRRTRWKRWSSCLHVSPSSNGKCWRASLNHTHGTWSAITPKLQIAAVRPEWFLSCSIYVSLCPFITSPLGL